MRIGILTFHRAHNFGAVLQCFALQEVMKRLGHDVKVIDYRQPRIEQIYKPFKLKHLIGLAVHIHKSAINYLTDYPKRKHREKAFNSFAQKYLQLTQPCTENSIPQDFDAYLIGSDQLWNPWCLGGKMDNVYLGHFKRPENSQLYGYAISATAGAIDNLGAKQLSNIIASFSALSLREQTAAKVLGAIAGTTPQVCCDPTLLTDQSFWDPVTNNKFQNRKYVLLYQVRYPKNDRTLLNRKAQQLANSMNCELITATPEKYSVEDFVSLFKYASHVVTSSFHATVFSLIFQTPFYSVKLKDGGDARYEELLNSIGAESLCVDANFEPVPANPDFKTITKKLNNYKQQSINFLRQIK